MRSATLGREAFAISRTSQHEESNDMGEIANKAKGRIKRAAGALTGNEELEIEGAADEVRGEAEGVVDDVKRAAKGAVRAVKKAVKK